jgi:hypothetical protein
MIFSFHGDRRWKIHYVRSLPLAKALMAEVILAYIMNSEPLSPSHGFPLRAVLPGWYGMALVKWLTRIVVINTAFRGYFQTKMRFMVIVKATKNSEAGVMPSEQLLTEMGKYNEELAKAGVLLAGEGLHPSSKGARVKFSCGERTVIDGPFSETKELVAGFWLWKCDSLQEAIEWVKRCPNPMPGEESEIEIRQVFESEDFGPALTPELRVQEERLRAEVAQDQGT